MRLAQSDLTAILQALSDADALDSEEADGPAVRERLRVLIPSDRVSYEQADVTARRFTDPRARRSGLHRARERPRGAPGPELLRPHLRAREARADLRRRVLASTVDQPGGLAGTGTALTPHEREVVFLVGAVKKHRENASLKLGVVGSRAAAASEARSRGTVG